MNYSSGLEISCSNGGCSSNSRSGTRMIVVIKVVAVVDGDGDGGD